MRSSFIIRRSFASRAVVFGGRVPLLEELFEVPVLETSRMDQDTLVALKGYTPPVLSTQIEASLTAEFRRPIMKTNWSLYRNPFIEADEEQAARLLQLTLSVMKGACSKYWTESEPPQEVGCRNSAWLERECNRLGKEIRRGDYSRWVDPSKLMNATPIKWEDLTAKQQEAIRPAIELVARNPHYYPTIKSRILHEVADVIKRTVS